MNPAEAAATAREEIWAAAAAGTRSTLVDSPPGAGKSTLVREIGRRARRRAQVPIVVQTKRPICFDLCRASAWTSFQYSGIKLLVT